MAKPNTDFVDDVPEVNTDFVDDVAPAPEGPTDFIAKAKAEGRAEELPNGLVRVQAPDKSFSQVFDAATGQYVATPEDLKSIQQGTASRSKVEGLKSLLGMAQAVSPFTDEAQAAASTVGKGLQGKSTSYANELAGARKTIDEASSATPLGLKLAAGLGSGVAAPMTAATFAGRMGLNAATGAVQGIGASESDSVGGYAADALKGAALTAGLGAGLEGVGAGASWAAKKAAPILRKYGEKAALKAVGIYGGIVNRLQDAGYPAERIAGFVDDLEASGVIKLFSTTEDTYNEILKQLSRLGDSRDEVIASLDQMALEKTGKAAISPNALSVSMTENLPKTAAEIVDSGKAKTIINQLAKNPQNISMSDAVAEKIALQNSVNRAVDPPNSVKNMLGAERGFLKSLEAQASEVSPELAESYKGLNKQMSPLMAAKDFAGNDATREFGRSNVRLKDLMLMGGAAGGGAAAFGGGPAAVLASMAGAAGLKYASDRAASTLTPMLLKGSRGLQNASAFELPQMTQNTLVNNYLNTLMQSQEDKKKEGEAAFLSQQ